MSLPVVKGSAVTSDDATPKNRLGAMVTDTNGNLYRYILVEDADLANGDVVEYADTSGYEVTNDRSGGASIGRMAAGVAVGTITDGQYGYVMVSGRHSAVKTDGAVAKGDRLVPHASADGRADTEASGSTVAVTSGQVFGIALATDSGTTSAGTVAAIVRCV